MRMLLIALPQANTEATKKLVAVKERSFSCHVLGI